MNITKAFIVDTPHIERILSGQKTWELRSRATKIRGQVALIRKGSGQIVGTVEISNSVGPLTEAQMIDNIAKHCVDADRLKSGKLAKYKHAWVLQNPRPLADPVAYAHPRGAVIWVNLQPDVAAQISK